MKDRDQKDFFSGIKFRSSEDDDTLLKSMLETLPEQEYAEDSLVKRDKKGAFRKTPARSRKKGAFRNTDFSRNPDATLDLHGKTEEEAIILVQNFVTLSYRRHLRSLLIITGKGSHSGDEGPVLNHATRSWLQRNGAPFIKDFFPASPRHGGSGAFWVDLR